MDSESAQTEGAALDAAQGSRTYRRRLERLSRAGRRSAVLASIVGILPLVGITGCVAASSAGYPSSFDWVVWLVAAVALGVPMAWVFTNDLRRLFSAFYLQTQDELRGTQLAVVAIDEQFVLSLVDRERSGLLAMLSPPSLPKRLEERMRWVAAHKVLLQRAPEDAGRMLYGDRARLWWHCRLLSGVFHIFVWTAALLGLLPLVGLLAAPFTITAARRYAELQGTLCAICDFFAEGPMPPEQGGSSSLQ